MVSYGEKVLLVDRKGGKHLITLEEGGKFHTKHGEILHDEVVAVGEGGWVSTHLGVKYAVLKPCFWDLLQRCRRGPQAVHPKDIGIMLVELGVEPGMSIIDVGSGSGILISALANYVGEKGRVVSYEMRKEFAEIAKKNVEALGLVKIVEIREADITKGVQDRGFDVATVDMANPWDVIPVMREALKPGGRIGLYTPSITQVIRSVKTLKENMFVDIRTMECLTRNIRVEEVLVRPESWMLGHTAYMTFARKTS